MIHPLAWVGWLVAVLVTLSAGRNPLHLVLVLLCIAVVEAARQAGVQLGQQGLKLALLPVFLLFASRPSFEFIKLLQRGGGQFHFEFVLQPVNEIEFCQRIQPA
jgi:hypothetical protein